MKFLQVKLRAQVSRSLSSTSPLKVMANLPFALVHVRAVSCVSASAVPVPVPVPLSSFPCAHAIEGPDVLPHVPLKGENPYFHQPRVARRSFSDRSFTFMPTMASPSPRDTLATISGSLK